jgi:hypothetical protein
MVKDRVVERLGGLRERMPVVVIVGLLASLVSLGVAAASGSAQSLSGPFAVFDQCPRFTAGVNFCTVAKIESGGTRIGAGGLLIVNPITLKGGYERNEEKEPVTERFVGALDGETLSRTPQPIPGGLAGLINCEEIKGRGFFDRAFRRACQAVLGNPSLTALNATTELAAPVGQIGISTDNLINQEGVALSLPVKIHLENPLLGNRCYIGSDWSPIVLNLTTGTTSPPPPNQPISGKSGTPKFLEDLTLIEITGTTLVDNSFAVPAVSGCGGPFASLIDPILDAKLGLPAPAGYNTLLYNASLSVAIAEELIKLEKGQTEGKDEGSSHEKWGRRHGHGHGTENENENENYGRWWH